PSFPHIPFPTLFAFEVVTIDTSGTVPDNDVRTVCHRRGRTIRIRSVRRLHGRIFDGSNPKALPCSPVEAIEVSLSSLVFRTGDEDPPVRNDGAAVPRTRQGCLPSNVLVRTPMDGRFIVLRDAISVRAAECRPVSRERAIGEQHQQHERWIRHAWSQVLFSSQDESRRTCAL